jgi:ketosteroid isomerase-like protein
MMTDGGGEAVVRGFAEALESGDLERTLGHFTSDAVYSNPSGEFKGTEEIRRYLRWMFETNSDLKIKTVGIGVLAAGNRAAFEHTVGGTFQGSTWELPMLCSYEFTDGKIRRIVTIYDRLALAKQVAKGWMARRAVAAVIKGSERGLR